MSKNTLFIRSLLLLAGFFMFFRIGGHTPLPFINIEAYVTVFSENDNSLLSMYNLMSGGSLARMSIFTLGIMPYITASIFVFMLQMFSESFKARMAEEDGTLKAEKLKRVFTIILAGIQSITLATVLLSSSDPNGMPLVSADSTTFYITTAASLIAGTFCAVWIANMITFIGFGSGLSILIMLNILTSMPANFYTIHSLYETGVISNYQITTLIAVVLAAFAMIILMENAERRVPVIKPDSTSGSKRTTHNLKANPVGIMPPIFAAICLSMPLQFMDFFPTNSEWILTLKSYISHGTVSYIFFFATLTFIFGFQMVKMTAPPQRLCDQFRHGSFIIPSISVGKDTDKYLKDMSRSLTIIGCIYMVVLCTIPELINYFMGIPLYLGGTSILIMVSTSVDMKNQSFEMLEGNKVVKLKDKLMES